VGKIIEYVKATWFGFITLPVLLVIIQFFVRELYLMQYGIIITLYKGHPIAINYIVRWLLLIDKEALQGSNLAAVIITWILGWIFVSDWVRDKKAIASGIFLTYIAYILYLSLYHGYPVTLYFPESFYQLIASLIFATVATQLSTKRRRIGFFERLEKVGIKVPEKYKVSINVPTKCPACGAILYSNPYYCWKCGEAIEDKLATVGGS